MEPSRASRPTSSELFWAVWAVVAAFGTYFCMYAFRKPFTAAKFDGTFLFGVDFKTILVTAQVGGYTLSKFIGIRVVSETPPRWRVACILALVLFAQVALVLFGLVPRPWNAVCLFLNGVPLGMVFGLVLSTLEGRRLTEALAAGLCASFILADGVTKSVGTWLLNWGVSEEWMPALTGVLFLAPLGAFLAMLSRVPPPSRDDVVARAHRPTLTRTERWRLTSRYAGGLIPIVVVFLGVTILRSIRADFAPEIWKGLLGTRAEPAMFSLSEILVALGVLVVNGGAILIHDNRRAFFAALGTCAFGIVLLVVALLARPSGVLGGFEFVVLIGVGLYLPYVAIHTTVFERFLAMTRDCGTVGFLLTGADSIGYLGYVAVIIARKFFPTGDDLVGLLTGACWLIVAVSMLCLVQAWRYFAKLSARVTESPTAVPEETVAEATVS
jgi:Family of unknown function (DUF5690)